MSQKSHKYGFKPRIELSTGIQPPHPTPQLTNAETDSFVKFCTVKMEHLIEMTISKIFFLSVEGFWYRTLRSSTVTQTLFTQSLFCVCFEFFIFLLLLLPLLFSSIPFLRAFLTQILDFVFFSWRMQAKSWVVLRIIFAYFQSRCCLSFAPCFYKSLSLSVASRAVWPVAEAQQQSDDLFQLETELQLKAHKFRSLHLQLEYRRKFLFEIVQNFNLLCLHRVCADKGNLQYWTMAINKRQ